jgi:hypothetical protein
MVEIHGVGCRIMDAKHNLLFPLDAEGIAADETIVAFVRHGRSIRVN